MLRFYKGFGRESGYFWRNWHGDLRNGPVFIRVWVILRECVSCKIATRKMQFGLMIYSVFEEGGSASRNAYKPNVFSIILGTFLRKWRRNHQETTGFIRVCTLQFCARGNLVLPRNNKGFQHMRIASENAYKHNAFPMFSTPCWWKLYQKPQ